MSKTDDYLAMAQGAADSASGSTLANVRELHERSAAVWRELARSEQDRERRRAEILLAAARRLKAADQSIAGEADGS